MMGCGYNSHTVRHQLVPKVQQFTACICLIVRYIAPGLWGPSRGAISSYIDDCFYVSCSMSIAVLSGELLVMVVEWLGCQLSPSKCTIGGTRVKVLGIIIASTPAARTFEVPQDKADGILPVLHSLLKNASQVPQATLETCLGQLGFLAYLSTYGSRYVYPMYALLWLPMPLRATYIHGGGPLSREVRTAIKWWIALLESDDKILWSSKDDPLQWILVNSDACPHGWAATDYTTNFFASGILDTTKEAIAIYELRAMRQYVAWAQPDFRTGLLFLCDNTNVMHTVRRGYCKSNCLRQEFNVFADLCERMSLRCAVVYVKSKNNLMTDLGSRCRPILGASMAAALARHVAALPSAALTAPLGDRADDSPDSAQPPTNVLGDSPLAPIALGLTPSSLTHAILEAQGRWPLISD